MEKNGNVSFETPLLPIMPDGGICNAEEERGTRKREAYGNQTSSRERNIVIIECRMKFPGTILP